MGGPISFPLALMLMFKNLDQCPDAILSKDMKCFSPDSTPKPPYSPASGSCDIQHRVIVTNDRARGCEI